MTLALCLQIGAFLMLCFSIGRAEKVQFWGGVSLLWGSIIVMIYLTTGGSDALVA